MLSCFRCVGFFATLWTTAHQALLSKGFPRQEHWSELPCPPPGDLPNPGLKPASLRSPALAGRFFTTITTWEPWRLNKSSNFLRVTQLLGRILTSSSDPRTIRPLKRIYVLYGLKNIFFIPLQAVDEQKMNSYSNPQNSREVKVFIRRNYY